jgi:CubicO group peptidase (beta-lactamase class C family)
MKKICVLLFALFNLISCTHTEPEYNAKKIDHLISQLVEDERTVGVAYNLQIDSIISKHNEFGYDDFEKKTTLQKNAQFRIASMTKPFTATAIMQLIEKGKLSLNDTIDIFFQTSQMLQKQQFIIYFLIHREYQIGMKQRCLKMSLRIFQCVKIRIFILNVWG